MSDFDAFPCPACQIGYCQPGKGTYLRLVNGTLVSAPDMPLWICDVCDYQEFDRDAVLRVEALLGQPDHSSGTGRTSPKIQSPEAPDAPAPRRAKP